MKEGALLPGTRVDTLVRMVEGSGHMEKTFTFDGEGNMYVNIGSMSNACQEEQRTKGSKGMDPCPELETRAGIWRFDDHTLNQEQDISLRYATGIRNAVAISWNREVNKLYALQHGRDDLHRFWPDLYTEEQNLELPAEEFLEIEEGDDFGWPYCYWDQFKKKKLLNPEYGGDGEKQGRCANIKPPIYAFPGHWAPNDLLFYRGDMFPERYKNGAFIAWHGSWNRLGYDQAGFNVAFLPMKNGKPTGEYEIFADGFKGMRSVRNTGDAKYRPCGLAEGPDGSLYVVDSQVGRVWRIMYYPGGLIKSANQSPAVPEEIFAEEESVPEELLAGKRVYDAYCTACHMSNGKGVSGMNPPLAGSEWVLGEKSRIINVVLHGLSDPVEINGETYQNIMASHAFLSDQQIADVLTYVRQSFGNDAGKVTKEEVAAERSKMN
jgi:glucose/arabinose dehydrogenase/cytochrome c553